MQGRALPAALHAQHETGEIISRVNAFLGFPAIGKVRIVQKPVAVAAGRKVVRPRELSAPERKRLAHVVEGIEDPDLRASLERLGAAVLGSRKPKA